MESLFYEHFRNPRNAVEIPDADGTGHAGAASCGAVISIYIRFDGDGIGSAGFQATGSSAAIAAGSLLTDMIVGRSWREAAALPESAIEAALSGTGLDEDNISPVKLASIRSAAMFAIEALHAAFEDAIARGRFPVAAALNQDAVLVAMSGGVDSAVACLLEQKAGRSVTGITMRLWRDPESNGRGKNKGASGEASGGGNNDTTKAGESTSCCSPQAIRDARGICHTLGLPHLTVDYSSRFESEVVDVFVSEYVAGRTPNPCTRCNGALRFPELVRLADRLGCARVATGHYARLTSAAGSGNGRHGSDCDEGRLLRRAIDRSKDQSYMLWAVDRSLLARLDFPLGGILKAETRALARDGGLAVHDRPESQEVCFIPDDDYRGFVRRRCGADPGSGNIVDSKGARLGEHPGYIDFTVGQRRGLGVSSPAPLYVLRTDPVDNLVVAGSHDELAVTTLIITDVNEFATSTALSNNSLLVQARYNSGAVGGRVAERRENDWTLALDEPVFGIAPGQSAVLYEGDTLVAGGVIKATG